MALDVVQRKVFGGGRRCFEGNGQVILNLLLVVKLDKTLNFNLKN